MEIAQLHSLFKASLLIDTDTRKIRKGSLFFALKGANFNGNQFAEEALKKGASYAIIDEEAFKTDKTILVEDVLHTLHELAKFHRRSLGIPIISLTGSNGKTTTKELINAVLSKNFNTSATEGNLNNHIGVPLTLLSMTKNTEIGIVEMGANHLKEIELLCSIAEPNFGYITNFGKAHLEGFGSFEGIIQGKSELYNYLRKSNGIAFINSNDTLQVEKSNGIQSITFDTKSITFKSADPFVEVIYKDQNIKSQLIGKYNYNNIAAAICIGNHFNIGITAIQKAIEEYIPTNNRSQIIQKNSNNIILDAYNANPSSMLAALENFDQLEASNKIAILGDMFELGNTSQEEHQDIADLAASMNFNRLFLIGKAFSTTNVKNAFVFDSFESFKDSNDYSNISNTSILIKGSRGMALERILSFL